MLDLTLLFKYYDRHLVKDVMLALQVSTPCFLPAAEKPWIVTSRCPQCAMKGRRSSNLSPLVIFVLSIYYLNYYQLTSPNALK